MGLELYLKTCGGQYRKGEDVYTWLLGSRMKEGSKRPLTQNKFYYLLIQYSGVHFTLSVTYKSLRYVSQILRSIINNKYSRFFKNLKSESDIIVRYCNLYYSLECGFPVRI